METSYQGSTSRSNSRYKSTVHLQTSARDHPTSNSNRRRRVDNDNSIYPSVPPPTSYNNPLAYQRSQPSSSNGQLTSRSYHPNYPISLSLRSTSSRPKSLIEDSQSNSSYASLITVTNRPRVVNSSSNHQIEDLSREMSVQGKRYSTDLTNLSMKIPNTTGMQTTHHYVQLPQSNSIPTIEKSHSHVSCPIAYQNQTNQGTNTILSDSSSDNTILHHLPDHNETTDKSQQSSHDERVHRSPRKTHNHLIGTRLRSTSSIDEQKKTSIPSIFYNIGPIESHDDLHDENQYDSKQKAIREERKRKSNENEQVLINVDEYAPEILLYLKEREVNR